MGELLRAFLEEITADSTRFLVELAQSLILLGILGWAGRISLRKRLAARQARIASELAEAEQAERDAGRLLEEARSRAERAQEEAPELVRQAETQAQQERAASIAGIEAEATALIVQAREGVERDKARVGREATSRLVELTALATRRYLEEMQTESERRALTQKAILASLSELTGSTPSDTGAP